MIEPTPTDLEIVKAAIQRCVDADARRKEAREDPTADSDDRNAAGHALIDSERSLGMKWGVIGDAIAFLENEIYEWEESDKAGRAFTDIIDELNAENARLTRERDEALFIFGQVLDKATVPYSPAGAEATLSVIWRMVDDFLARTQPTPVSGEPKP